MLDCSCTQQGCEVSMIGSVGVVLPFWALTSTPYQQRNGGRWHRTLHGCTGDSRKDEGEKVN